MPIRSSRLYHGLLGGLALLACESPAPTSNPQPPDDLPVIAPAVLRDVVEDLAHDSTAGRAAASPELEKAARYVAEHFSHSGLVAGGTDGFLQRFRFNLGETVNTIGWVRGSDPRLAEEYLVYSAHLDHLGVRHGSGGDSIYNGADDNASGVAALMALATAFGAMSPAPPRTIVFIAFSGEESGLLGSRYFTDHATYPLERTVAVLNLDMVGRNVTTNVPDPRNSVAAVGKARSFLGSVADRVAEAHPEVGIRVLDDPWPEESLFARSDHVHFVRNDIPALFFTTGLHEDYHRTSDEVERLDYIKLTRITRLLLHIGIELANTEEFPFD